MHELLRSSLQIHERTTRLSQACLKKMSAEAEGETKEAPPEQAQAVGAQRVMRQQALASPSYRSSAEKAIAFDEGTVCNLSAGECWRV